MLLPERRMVEASPVLSGGSFFVVHIWAVLCAPAPCRLPLVQFR